MGKRVQNLFAAFRTLEEFGLERPGDEQKQISETHEHQSTSQNAEISSLSSPTGGDKSNHRRYSDAEAIDSNHQGRFTFTFLFLIVHNAHFSY